MYVCISIKIYYKETDGQLELRVRDYETIRIYAYRQMKCEIILYFGIHHDLTIHCYYLYSREPIAIFLVWWIT